MTTNYQPWIFAFAIFQFVFSLVNAWWTNRNKVSNSRFKDIEERLGKVEKTVLTMPTCGNHARMEDTDKHINNRLDNIGKLLAKIDGRLEGINRMVDLLTQNELKGGK